MTSITLNNIKILYQRKIIKWQDLITTYLLDQAIVLAAPIILVISVINNVARGPINYVTSCSGHSGNKDLLAGSVWSIPASVISYGKKRKHLKVPLTTYPSLHGTVLAFSYFLNGNKEAKGEEESWEYEVKVQRCSLLGDGGDNSANNVNVYLKLPTQQTLHWYKLSEILFSPSDTVNILCLSIK